MFRFYIAFYKRIDSEKLWNCIKGSDVHLIDLIDKVHIYGDTSLIRLNWIIQKCEKVGKFVCTIYGGVEDEQTQNETLS